VDFTLSQEQLMLQQSAVRLLAAECTLAQVRELAARGGDCLRPLWRQLVDLGVPGILIPEQHGGVGLGFLEAALLAEALGGAVAPVPFVTSSVMAPVALLEAGSDAQRARWLPRLAAGEAICGVGLSEQHGAREGAGLTAANGRLSGTALFVLDALAADLLLVADRQQRLYLVEASAPGVRRQALRTIDRTRSVAEVTFDGAVADLLPGSAKGPQALLAALDAGRLMLAADTLGAAQSMLDKAVAYARERRQFNRVIGSFQAVKHMCAEMAAELEPCRALVWYAAHAARALPGEARLMTCHAKAHLSEVGQFVARTATEVHGGMGFTDLLGLHYWFKRIGFNRQHLGSPEEVRADAARVQGWA
jgi:alkylation response protein AidB-like acyl-CoA dehydrogenase